MNRNLAKMGGEFAVLVEALATIPAHVQQSTHRKHGPNEAAFVHTVKGQDTISKHVQYYILKNTRNGRKELMVTGFVHSVGRLGITNEHVPKFTLWLHKTVRSVWRCEGVVCAESVDCPAITQELVNLARFKEIFRYR